jgi:hypothetical protein
MKICVCVHIALMFLSAWRKEREKKTFSGAVWMALLCLVLGGGLSQTNEGECVCVCVYMYV